MGDLRLITSVYPGKCRKCGLAHRKGDQVWWRKGEKGVVCGACKPQERPNVPAPAPSAPKPAPAPDDGRKIIGGRTVREFQSWNEWVDYADSHKNPRESSHSNDMGEKWHGGKSFADALSLARHGWQEVRPQVDALVDRIDAVIAPVLEPAFVNYFDVSGGGVDIGRYLNGEPECMMETKLATVAKPGRVVSILVDGFYSSGIGSADIIRRGCAIVALVDSLEKLQHNTEIWLEMSLRSAIDRKPITYLVKLKGAEDALDVDMLMFAVANPASYRRIGFAAQERVGENREFRAGESNNYGGPDGLKMGEYVGAAISLERLNLRDETRDAEVWIKSKLSEFGLITREEG